MRILILCAHTDDESGCAGTIARLQPDHDIRYIAFSGIEVSLKNEGKDPGAARKECKKSLDILGISNYEILKYPVRTFPSQRQDILEFLVSENKTFDPHIIMTPATVDIHQDHQVITQEAIRAFKYKTILGYEMPQNSVKFCSAVFFKLEQKHIAKKLVSISCYESQYNKPYFNPKFILNLANLRGVQSGCEYAEAFEVIGAVI